ncbi:hypothetical protein [Halorussus halophilus]|uniref:hypothetical protein n=1 Tax=Halorussus halophilus TaxID=2650975 RepID=UPI001301790C|nr:hypothetical protein [Halorussus halophilus]
MTEANADDAANSTDRQDRTRRRRRPSEPPQNSDSDARTYLFRGALVVLGLVAVVALFGFYQSVNAVIDQFIDGRYRPVFRAAFNLVVLLAAGIGISWTVRELSE